MAKNCLHDLIEELLEKGKQKQVVEMIRNLF